MAAATVTKYLNIGIPTMEVVQLTVVTDADTYASRKFTKVQGGIACFQTDGLNDSINVVNSDNTALDGTDDTIRLNSDSISTSPILLVLFGDEGALA